MMRGSWVWKKYGTARSSAVVIAACFFPLATPACAAVISSTFDTDADGWTVTGTLNPLEYHASGGSPGGNIFSSGANPACCITPWYFVAPSKYLGDQSASYRQTLDYDLKGFPGNQLSGHPEIILTGGNLTLYWDTGHPEVGFANHYEIPLDETAVIQYGHSVTARWRIAGTSTQPTQAEFLDVLTNLSALQIRGGYGLEGGSGAMDNVTIHAVGTPGSLACSLVAVFGLGALRSRRRCLTS